jgi:hypothetical protein
MEKYAKIILTLVIFLGLVMWVKMDVLAIKKIVTTPTVEVQPTLIPTSTVEVKNNLTENTVKNKVVEVRNRMKWNGFNSIQKLIEISISRGVAPNTIVLLLLLPLVATMVSILHYIVGLSGYGIFMPTMVAVVFLATGVAGGILLFATILAISILSNYFLKRFKLHFWPARSINLLFIAMGTFGLMIGSSYLDIISISNISIFPILFMILLVEEFTRTQLIKSKTEALSLTMGTLILSIVGAMMMSVREIQLWVIDQPEITLIVVLIINLLVGSYTGIRLTEIKRFAKAIRVKSTRS